MKGNKKILISVVAIIVVLLGAFLIINAVPNSNKQDNEGEKMNDNITATPIATAVATNTPTDSEVKNKTDNNIDSTISSAIVTPKPDAKPTFMYFISAKDEKYAETNAIIENLKKKYGDKVTFDIRNVDDNQELVSQFSIAMTPTLYMMDRAGDFKDMKFGFSTQEQLEESINKAL